MKPTSIVFLIIAVLLIVGGVITCSVAEDIALTDNYALFHSSEDGGTYVREDFDPEKIRKIELLVTDAEIQIIGGSEEAYVEFINFRDGLYTLSNTGEMLSMDEIPNLESLFNLQSGFSFGGMRYILQNGTVGLGEKKINVYLPTETALKQISVEANNCVLRAEKLLSRFDLNVIADKRAELHFSDFRTACRLEVTAATADVHLQGAYLNTVSLKADTVEGDFREMYWDRLELDLEHGNLHALSTVGLHRYIYDLKGKGTLTVNGTAEDLPYSTSDGENSKNVPAISGDIGHAHVALDEIID